MTTLTREIYAAVEAGKLREPFNARMARHACRFDTPRAYRTFNSFMANHCVGNPRGEAEYFIRTSRGWYKFIRRD